MKYLIISFKNRNNLMTFNRILTNRGIVTSIINTPRRVAISCGLSIKTDLRNLTTVINILNQNNFSDFIGIFLFERFEGHEQIRKIL